MEHTLAIKLARPDVIPLEGFSDHTLILTTPRRFHSDVVLGFSDRESIGALAPPREFFPIPSSHEGWNLELAVVLPDLLHRIDGRSEAVLEIADSGGSVRTICLSNRISRFNCVDREGEPFHVLLPRAEPWHGSAAIGAQDDKVLGIEEQLRTVAAMTFTIQGDTPDQAFESSVSGLIEELFAGINAVLQAMRQSHPETVPNSRSISRYSVHSIYALMYGSSRAEALGAVLMVDPMKGAWYGIDLKAEESGYVRRLLRGEEPLSDVDRIIGEAQSSLQNGELEFALLQAVIAAEICAKRAIHNACLRAGISKKKLKNVGTDMSYSWALNVGLKLAFPPDARPPEDIVEAMDMARDRRNRIMHDGRFSLNRKEVLELLAATRRFVGAIRAGERRYEEREQ